MLSLPNSFKNNPLKHAWHYKDQSGKVFGAVARYDGNGGSKDVVPFFKTNGDKFEMGGAPLPRPLFGLDTIKADERSAVYVVEGEKTAACMHELGFAAATSCGGSAQPMTANWSSLNGLRQVVLLPDNDAPGLKYCQAVAKLLSVLPQPPEIAISIIPNLPDAGDVVDWVQAHLPNWDGYGPIADSFKESLRDELLKVIEDNQKPVPADWLSRDENEWPMPINLEAQALPEWPRYCLPDSINAFAQALSASTETPSELAGLLCLSVLSAAGAGKYEVNVEGDYVEPVCLWTCISLPPASRKTAVLTAVTKPLMAWECEQRKNLEAQVRESKSDYETLQERILKKRREAASSSKEMHEDLMQEIHDIEASLKAPIKFPQLWTNDITPENLAMLMAENDERMAVLADEGGIFENIAGRYSNGTPNFDVFLQAHAGSSVRVNRASRDSIYLKKPVLTFGLTTQPDVLRSIANKPGFRGRGLLARFLYAMPQSNLGYRVLENKPIPQAARNGYESVVAAVLNHSWQMAPEGKVPHTLRLTPESQRLWKEYQRMLEVELREGGRLAHITDWAGKLPGAVIRIAALLHIASLAHDDPWKVNIHEVNIDAAISIAKFLSCHALAVFDFMGADNSLEQARIVLKWIQREKLQKFTFRDCHYAHKNIFKRAAELEDPIGVLIERNFIREVTQTKVSHRRSRFFDVSPNLIQGFCGFCPDNQGIKL